jgi:ferredoxin
MLKKTRVGVSAVLFALITFYFIDFAELLPGQFGWLARVQFLPAVSRSAIVIIAAWLLLTFLAGRVYCSSVCPLGIFQDIVGWISRRAGKKKRYRYRPPRTILRVVVLVVAVVAILVDFPLLLGLVEPYSAYGRVATSVFKPVYLAGNNLLETIFSIFNNHAFYRVSVFVHDLLALAVGVVTVAAIGWLAWTRGRTWCNTLCPVGALLGLASRYSLFKARIDAGKCTRCGACAAGCKAGCINTREKRVDNSRCVACFNCLGTCRFDAFTFKPGAARDSRKVATPDASRRQFLLAAATTAASVPVALNPVAAAVTGGRRRQHPIAPPGAMSIEHLSSHCTSCHLCISKCPSRVLKPAFLEYGVGGMMQPTVYYERGFCNYNCTVCGDVCPNGAIHALTTERKQMTQVGHVVLVEESCVVITDGTSCGACSEHCPTQAVTMVPYRGGLTRPRVDTTICVGCGGCEYICPVRPARAIYVEGHAVQADRAAFKEEAAGEVVIDDFGF